MQDVYFLEWRIDPGLITLKQEIGYIETQKATSALYAPLAGRIVRFNAALLEDPSTINVDNYGKGWLFEMTGELVGHARRGRLLRPPRNRLGGHAADAQGPVE